MISECFNTAFINYVEKVFTIRIMRFVSLLFYLGEVLQSYVADLRDKMTSISLYGVVTYIIKEDVAPEVVFSIRIADTSGVVWAKLHFNTSLQW